ncbi:TetR/AcrR family transcriptional regulator [Actinopolymorpha alba]|uniref:TetR/AcrR family transcriptional regulator n=1 Tax=Actinopolymorpha alba TaxID=533267 RepID=UPI00037D3BFD|nr:TetR/AcrR family transcriptional regulator [Actinopolymorpha alba]
MPISHERPLQPRVGGPPPPPSDVLDTPGTVRRLRRAERRDQILSAATQAFGRSGFAATSLDAVATEAGVSRVILYRHFESKADLYRAVLDRANARLAAAFPDGQPFTMASIDALLDAATADPAGFRLLFHHAAREPAFREEMDRFRETAVAIAHDHLVDLIPDDSWARWAAQLAPTVAIDAVIAWLDAGRPDPGQAADRIRQLLAGLIQAAAARPTERP